ncbi:hypothetical protein [Vibrio alfacsensis]|uniref:hypothetical protein n=1 Tax=Vibrio alfacsensis TaxID=1074311 RepID=UPI004067E8C3
MKLSKIQPLSYMERVGDSYADLIQKNASQLIVSDQKLKLEGTILHFFNEVEGYKDAKTLNLSDIWMPGTAGFEHPVPLLLYPHHSQTILSSVDQYANSVNYNPSFITQAKSRLRDTLRFVEWALLNEHYKLNTVSPQDIERFCSDISAGGIAGLLGFPQRLEHLWQSIYNQPDQIIGLVNSDGYGGVVTGFRELAIKKVLGTNCTATMIPNRYYCLFGNALVDSGIRVKNEFFSRGTDLSQPSAKSLNTLFGEWNYLSRMEHGDSLSFLPFKDPYKKSSDLGRPESRTKNLNVEHVISLLGEANLWVFKASPLIIRAVRELAGLRHKSPIGNDNEKYSIGHITGKLSRTYLSSSKTLNKLEKVLGISISRVGVRNSSEDKWSLCECITGLMSACFILLQIYNARREAEIQDPIIGISKKEHFRCVNKKQEWYQACFYNEKHGGRYWYTLNKSSAKSLQVLFSLSNAWENNFYSGLFNVPNFKLDDDYNIKAYIFNFNKGKASNYTGDKFLDKALGENTRVVKGTHVFRRIYALIYHYQYENSELLALTHQLGHIDPENTLVYVTDPAARVVHEKLQHQLKTTKSDDTSSIIMFREECKLLNKTIKEVGIEKSAQDILALLMGSEKMAGRYPSYLKRVFKILRNSVRFNERMMDEYNANFSDLDLQKQSGIVANLLHERGHRNRPKPHSSCHRNPHSKKSHDDPCDPINCSGCAYQEVKQTHLDIMVRDLIDLQSIADDRNYAVLERMQASERASNLKIVISHHERAMKRTSDIFSHMRES